MPATYTKAEIEGLFGKELLPKSTIQLYTDRMVVVPYEEPSRRGLPRKYDLKNLAELLLCRKMVGIGFSIDQVRHLFKLMNANASLDLGNLVTIEEISDKMAVSLIVEFTKNGKVLIHPIKQAGTDKGKIVIDMIDKEHVRIINISEIINQVRKAV